MVFFHQSKLIDEVLIHFFIKVFLWHKCRSRCISFEMTKVSIFKDLALQLMDGSAYLDALVAIILSFSFILGFFEFTGQTGTPSTSISADFEKVAGKSPREAISVFVSFTSNPAI